MYNPNGKPVAAQPNAEMSLQIGNFNADGSINTSGSPGGNNVFNLAQMIVLNYIALHEATAPTTFANLNLVAGGGWGTPNVNNTLGTGSALESLIAFQPIVNGKIVGG